MRRVFGWEVEGERKVVGPTSFLSSLFKIPSLQIGEKIGVKSEKNIWTKLPPYLLAGFFFFWPFSFSGNADFLFLFLFFFFFSFFGFLRTWWALRVFWLKIAKNGVNCCYRYCSKLFDKMRRETKFRQWCCRNCKKKYNVSGERENWISVMRLPKFLSCPYCSKWKLIVVMALPKMEEKKIKNNCGN